MAGVVHDPGAMRARDLRDGLDIAALAVHMHIEDGVGAAGAFQRSIQILRPHQAGFRIDIGEDDLRPVQMRRAGGRQKSDGRNDDFRTRSKTQRARRHMQRRCAVGANDRMSGADGSGERGFEALDHRAGGEEIAAQRFGDGRDVVFLDELAPIGEEGVGQSPRRAERGRTHAKACISSVCNPRASRRSGLLSLE